MPPASMTWAEALMFGLTMTMAREAAWGGALLILVAIFIVITKQEDQTWIEAEAVTPTH